MSGVTLFEWDSINNVWVRKPAVVRTVRAVAAGQGVLGACKLYWIACSPDGPGAEFEITDAIAIDGAVVYDHFDNDKHSEQLPLDPPMQFTTGIWIEKFDHIHSLTFGYI